MYSNLVSSIYPRSHVNTLMFIFFSASKIWSLIIGSMIGTTSVINPFINHPAIFEASQSNGPNPCSSTSKSLWKNSRNKMLYWSQLVRTKKNSPQFWYLEISKIYRLVYQVDKDCYLNLVVSNGSGKATGRSNSSYRNCAIFVPELIYTLTEYQLFKIGEK